MRRARDLVGMPVVCEGRRLGRVLRAQLADDLGRMEGVWVGAGLRGTRFIPSERLELLGSVAVLADCAGERRRMEASRLPMRALSTDGQRLGAIIGAEVDEISFQTAALELSAGFWDDLFSPRQRVERYTVNRERGEVIIETAINETEASEHEERNVEGACDGHADRRLGGDRIRRAELADGAALEPEGQADRELDLGQGRGADEEDVAH